MTEESNYWTKFWQKRLSRRRLLAGSALVGSATGPEGSGGGGGSGAASDFLSLQNTDDPFDGRRKFETAPSDSHGGTLTYIGFDPVVLDRYDPHQTQFGPMYSNLAAVFSKLYMY
ncbi:MAG: hypothetical protein E6J42_08255, partial [Chloroflexi bacterium]